MSRRSLTHNNAAKGGNTLSVGLAMVQNMTTGSPGPPQKNALHSMPGLQNQTWSQVKPLSGFFPRCFLMPPNHVPSVDVDISFFFQPHLFFRGVRV